MRAGSRWLKSDVKSTVIVPPGFAPGTGAAGPVESAAVPMKPAWVFTPLGPPPTPFVEVQPDAASATPRVPIDSRVNLRRIVACLLPCPTRAQGALAIPGDMYVVRRSLLGFRVSLL